MKRWWRHRRGRVGAEVPPVQPGATWVHAASIGEVRAAEALIAHLEGPILLTADTDSGVQQALVVARGDRRVAAGARPMDLPWTLAPLWAEARPRAVVFVEGTFWPLLARRAATAGVPVIRCGVAGGVRTRRGGRWLLSRLWRPTTCVLARDDEAAAWLRRVQDAPVVVVGDPKADGMPDDPLLTWERPFVVAASTRSGDEARFLTALATVHPRPAALVAPRHPERFDAVETLLVERDISYVRRTRLGSRHVAAAIDVVLLDTLGELGAALVGAQAAFIGGTFDRRIGGHAPWEAARAGVPIVCGPHVAGHGTAFSDVGAVITEDLAEALNGPLPTPHAPRGAAARAASEVRGLLGAPAPETSPRPWLAPVAAAASAGTAVVRAAWDLGLREPVVVDIPVISIGSVNARSPGRTSAVRALVAELSARGHRVGVALRGYGRARRGRDVRTSWRTTSAADLGDEGALLASIGASVAAGPDRVAAARALAERGATVVVLDDGLQHRRLHRDLDVEIVDARFPGARGPIPAGERREPRPRRVDLVLVTHAGGVFHQAGLPVTRRPGAWQGAGPLHGPVAAFCGLGRPGDFLASLDLEVARFRSLRDHETPDLNALRAWADGLPLVCTAKDAARHEDRRGLWWRDVEVSLPQALLDRLPQAMHTASSGQLGHTSG